MSLNAGVMSSISPTWETPDDLFAALHEEFRFDLDAAAQASNAKLPRFHEPPEFIAALYAAEADLRLQLAAAKHYGNDDLAKSLADTARVCHRDLLAEQRTYLRSVQWASSTFLNPPYGDELPLWLEACVRQAQQGCSVVALVPARLDTAWWCDAEDAAHEQRRIRGRIKFKGGKSCAPFPSAVLVFRPEAPVGMRFARRICRIDTKGRVERVLFGDPIGG